MRRNTLQSALRSLCHTVCGFNEKKNKCEAGKHLVQPEQKLPKQQRREDDTSFILYTAVNSDDSVEEKNWAEEVTYMAMKREREWERKRWEGEQALALVSIYGLFIYARLSGFLPPTPAEDSHRMRDAPHRRKCFSPSLSRDAASRRLFLCFIPSWLICWHVCSLQTQTDKAVSWNHLQSPQMCSSSAAVLQRCSKNNLLLILSLTQHVFTHLW